MKYFIENLSSLTPLIPLYPSQKSVEFQFDLSQITQ